MHDSNDTLADFLPLTPDLQAERLRELRRLFPDLFDGEGQLKADELRQLTGEALNSREHYDFTWNGKRHAKAKAYRPTTATLTHDEQRSVNAEVSGGNLIIEGENLESLKCLLAAYRDAIKCIYIDPPYNTGNDFVYSDDYSETRRAYWENSGQMEDGVRLDSNPETAGRYHSNWLSMMYPRLLLARQLLRDDGVIFISIDDHEAHNLRRLMDDIFGEENFIAQLVWSGGRKNDSKLVSISHEYIICYVKDSSHLNEQKKIWRQRKKGLDDIYAKYAELEKAGLSNQEMTAKLKTWYKELANSHPSKAHKHYNTIDDKGVYFPADISWPGGGGPKYDVLHPATKRPVKIPSRGWIYGSPERMKQAIEDNCVHFGEDENSVPCLKAYLKEKENQVPYSVFYQDGRASTKRLRTLMEADYFEHPKDEEVLQELIEFSSDNDAVVLDFFAGSGTTAQAVLELNAQDGGNRKFILVQIPEQTPKDSEARKAGYRKISDITIERVKRVIQGYGDNPKPLDAGFKVFRLTQSHFPRADFVPDPDKSAADNIAALHAYIAEKETQLTGLFEPKDIIDEVLLKNRFKLHYTLSDAPEFTQNKVWRADDGEREASLLCLDQTLHPETVRQLLAEPQAFICLERALETQDKWNLRNGLGQRFVAF